MLQYSLCHYIAVGFFILQWGFFHSGNMKNYILMLNTTIAQVSDQLIAFWDGVNFVHLVLY